MKAQFLKQNLADLSSLQKNYLKNIRLSFLLSITAILLFLAVVVTFPFKDKLFNALYSKLESQAKEQSGLVFTPKESEFLSNELLIKVKKETRDKIRQNHKDSGVPSLDKIFREGKVKKIEKVAKESKKSKADSEIFSWFKVTFEGKSEKMAGKFDAKKGFLDSSHPQVVNLQEAILKLRNDPNIEIVEPNFIVSAFQSTLPPVDGNVGIGATSPSASPSASISPLPSPSTTPTPVFIPNDPYYLSSGSWGQPYPDLWGLKKINMEGAWSQTSASVVIVADIDTGVDRNHEDLRDNMWVNVAEVYNNGVDDDGNGFIDDYFGWDFVNNGNDPMDDNGHGTHTAGTIAAAVNNNIGIAGVSRTTKIMTLKFLGAGGSGTLSGGAQALQYAADMGARVSSNSWGCNCISTLLDDALKYEYDKGMVIVAAVGNNNGDALDFSPASSEKVITVAATDPADAKASFSNWGEKIDVAAPGVDILSLRAAGTDIYRDGGSHFVPAYDPNAKYYRANGTSMAAPHVAGLAAMIASQKPSLSNEEIRQIIRSGSSDLGTPGKDRDFGFGRIEANNSLLLTETGMLTPIISSPRNKTLTTITSGQLPVWGGILGPNFTSYKVELGSGRSPTDWAEVASGTSQITNGLLATIDTTSFAENSLHTVRLTAYDSTGKSYQFQIFDLTVDNFDAAITFPLDFLSLGTFDVMGTALVKNALSFNSYHLEWGFGENPTTWSSEGVTLTNNGSSPVTNGLLGRWNTAILSAGQTFSLRLTVKATNGLTFQSQTKINLDGDLVSGWPKLLTGRGDGYDIVAPVMADLDGDGSKEIIIVDTTSKIQVFRKDGSNLPGFPVSLNPSYAPQWSANVEDLDNDGKKEIIIPDGFNIAIFRSDGTYYPGWPKLVYGGAGSPQPSDRTPIVADLDNDGRKELVVMEVYDAISGRIHALKLDGSRVSGFPKTISFINPPSYPYYGTLTASDLDGDGKTELAFGYNRTVYLFDNSGNLLPGWPYTAPLSTYPGFEGYEMVFHSPAGFGDIDGDGRLEIFALAVIDHCFGCNALLYGWEKEGTLLPGWPKETGNINWMTSRLHSPALANIDEDQQDEVVVGTYGLRAYDSTGLKFTEVDAGYPAMSTPAIADVNGDGKMEFTSVNYRGVSIAYNDGRYFWHRESSDSNHWFMAPAVLSDLDKNGKMELVVVRSPNIFFDKLTSVYLWEILGYNPVQGEWPMFMHDSARTGRLTTVSTAPTPTPSPTPTPTPTPSPTPSPSPTPTPTPSPYPSPTPTPTPTLPPDTTPPSVNITYPVNGGTVPRSSTVNVTASATDVSGIAKVEFYVNSKLLCNDTTSAYSCSWRVPAKKGVTYTLVGKAFDTKGNFASHSIKVTSR